MHDCGKPVQFARVSPGSDVILNDLKSPGVATVLPITVTFTYYNFVLVKGLYTVLCFVVYPSNISIKFDFSST